MLIAGREPPLHPDGPTELWVGDSAFVEASGRSGGGHSENHMKCMLFLYATLDAIVCGECRPNVWRHVCIFGVKHVAGSRTAVLGVIEQSSEELFQVCHSLAPPQIFLLFFRFGCVERLSDKCGLSESSS